MWHILGQWTDIAATKILKRPGETLHDKEMRQEKRKYATFCPARNLAEKASMPGSYLRSGSGTMPDHS